MRKILISAIFLCVIAGFSAFVLVNVNSMTQSKIEAQKEGAIEEAQKNVLSQAVTFNENKSITVPPIKAISGGVDKYQFIPGYSSGGALVGYVVNVSSTGYSSDIQFTMGISSDGSVTGIQITSQKETPGLGDKISGKLWEGHWAGITAQTPFNKSLDAFAGSTISPEAVYTGMMNALETFDSIKGGGNV
ncbi:MAG: RnfABCDGE type electron transport complex subunit G [Fusobacteria bacterium]|nr:RnfABCDGE type electron transport complex subunit G [Fusobacteriota bacterium]